MTHLRRSLLMRGLFAVSGLAVVLGCSSEKEPGERLGKKEQALSAGLVISQVFGGGGSASGTYKSDYVEIFNRGTTAVPLAGLSIQYAASASNFSASNVYVLTGTGPGLTSGNLAPGQYYLVKMSTGTGLADLTGADETSGTAINMSGTSGKVALVSNGTVLPCGATATRCIGAFTDAAAPAIIDYVGYGGATDFEGTAPAVTTSATSAAVRKTAGCTETDDNLLDF